MIKFIYWRHHEKFEEEEEDSETFRIMSFAMYLEEEFEGHVESITLADGTVLNGVREIEDYYNAHRLNEQKLLTGEDKTGEDKV